MLESPRSSQSRAPKYFSLQWILVNSLGAGVGIGLPILIGDRLSDAPYGLMVGIIGALLGFWLGLVQWWFLRKSLPLPSKWILVTGFSAIGTIFAVSLLVQIAVPLVFLLFILYPLSVSLSQWFILRSVIRPSWGWSIVSSIAMFMGGIIGLILGIIAHKMDLSPGITATIGGFSYGLVYGFISHFSLKRLVQKEPIAQPQKTGLDLPPDQSSWVIWSFQILSGLSLLLLIGLWIKLFPMPNSLRLGSPNLVLFGIAMLMYSPLSILMHELGHLFFAQSQQFDLQAIAVRRMVWIRQIQGFKLQRARRTFAGGFVLSVPQTFGRMNQRLFMMILGGPVGSLIFAIVGMLPWFLQSWIGKSPLAWGMGLLSIISLHMAILNALPLKVGYLRTDGRLMLDLFQNNRQGQRFNGMYTYNASLYQGIRPRDVDPALLDRLLALPEKSSNHVLALLTAYQVELDRGAIPQAANYLDEALAMHLYIPELFRANLLLEGAYFEAMIRDRADIARDWFNQIQEMVMTSRISLLRAEAAVCFAEGQSSIALTKAQEGLTLAEETDRFIVGHTIAEVDRLQEIIAKAS